MYLGKICCLSKILACPLKVGKCISSQQINYFVSVLTSIKSFARRTRMHSNIHRDIHTFLHTCMNSYIKTSGPVIPSTTDNRKIIFIHSGYFYSASLSSLLLRGAPDNRCKKRFLRFLLFKKKPFFNVFYFWECFLFSRNLFILLKLLKSYYKPAKFVHKATFQ